MQGGHRSTPAPWLAPPPPPNVPLYPSSQINKKPVLSSTSLSSAVQGVRVFLGKIPSFADDRFVNLLLTQCGTVLEWSRFVDPVDNKPVSFGFCRFEAPAGALAALRLLNGLEIDQEHKLIVHVDSNTRLMLDKFVDDLRDPLKMLGSDRTISSLTENDEMKRVVLRKLISQQRSSVTLS